MDSWDDPRVKSKSIFWTLEEEDGTTTCGSETSCLSWDGARFRHFRSLLLSKYSQIYSQPVSTTLQCRSSQTHSFPGFLSQAQGIWSFILF